MKPDLKIKTMCMPLSKNWKNWCAWEDGADPESPHGWGATEEQAKVDLIQQLEEE